MLSSVLTNGPFILFSLQEDTFLHLFMADVDRRGNRGVIPSYGWYYQVEVLKPFR